VPYSPRIPGAGGAGEQDVVTARDCDLERGARERLAADLGHVDRVGAARRSVAARRRGQGLLPAQHGRELAQVAHRVDGDPLDDVGLGGALLGDDDAAHRGGAREHGGGQHAAHRPHGAIEAELTEHE
jgi:hypothetical protein